jgi:hypothetical protein
LRSSYKSPLGNGNIAFFVPPFSLGGGGGPIPGDYSNFGAVQCVDWGWEWDDDDGWMASIRTPPPTSFSSNQVHRPMNQYVSNLQCTNLDLCRHFAVEKKNVVVVYLFCKLKMLTIHCQHNE